VGWSDVDEADISVTTPALLLSTAGTRLAYVNVSVVFPKLVARAGIAARSGRCRPRLHDMRHSFAVATLLGWYRDGGPIPPRLPRLSTYLGHTEPKNTYWYLHEGSGIASDGCETAGRLVGAAA